MTEVLQPHVSHQVW